MSRYSSSALDVPGRDLWLAPVAGLVAAGLTLLALRIGALPVAALALLLLVLPVVVTRLATSSLWAIGLVVLALPIGLLDFGALGPIDPVQVVVVLAVVVISLQRLAGGLPPLRWHPSAGWAVALLVLATVATALARDMVVAGKQLAGVTMAVLLALAVNAACARPAALRRIIVLLAVVGAMVCAFSLRDIGQIEAVAGGAGAVDNRAVGIFRQPNELGTFSAVIFFVGAGLNLGARTRLEQVAGVLTAALAAGALAVSLSRGAWIGAVLGVVVLAVLSRRARRLALAGILAVSAVGLPLIAQAAPDLWVVLRGRAAVLLERGSNPDDARPFIYREALRQMLDRPLTGHGPGNYVIASQTAESAALGVNALHGHNVLLTVATEAGIPAALLLVAFTVSVARHVLRARWELPDGDRELMLGLASGLVAVVGQGLVDFTFRNPVLLMLVWLLVGLVFAATRRDPGPAPLPRVPAPEAPVREREPGAGRVPARPRVPVPETVG